MKLSKPVVIVLCVCLGLGCIAAGVFGYFSWNDRREVFQDVQVELGTQSVGLADFMTELAMPWRCAFVSDTGSIDLSQTGETRLTLRSGKARHTVTLTVSDTIPPEADVPEQLTVTAEEGIPDAGALVQNIRDADRVTVHYADPQPELPEDYSDLEVVVVLRDASGNETEKHCTLSFSQWLKPELTWELGQTLPPETLLVNPQRDLTHADFSQAALEEAVQAVGEYEIPVTIGKNRESCTLRVVDTTPPELEVQDVHVIPKKSVTLDAFVVSVWDYSGDTELTVSGLPTDYSKLGSYPVTITARDGVGNETQKTATLWISNNWVAPVIRGATTTLTLEKHGTADFLAGVTARDDVDKNVTVEVDTSGLNPDVAGTYYITYSATDSSGNVGTAKRKVIVEHDAEDTAALVKELADTLSDDPEEIRDYVRKSIGYNHSWGGEDPTWYGFTTHSGNCYVHALCLQAILDLKGYETQLIWVTNKSHYWLIIKLDGVWKHIDATPSSQHQKYSLMNDAQRYSTLGGRNWDRSAWPACP